MSIPGRGNSNRFTLKLRGSFGRFQTDSSYSLDYMTSTLRANQLHWLSTASETFDIKQIDFEELIQRDVDPVRVRDMALNYLKHGRGRPIFFPPLLVCVAVLDPQRNLKEKYEDVSEDLVPSGDEQVLRKTFDVDGFRLNLYQADDQSSDRVIDFKGQTRRFYDYAAELELNPERTKLVVLDGQHRLEALRLLDKNADYRSIIAKIEQPICVVWMPEATMGSGDNIVKGLRSIFVTVNNEPLKVSGHFLTLLQDDSYSAMAVRLLADDWKRDDGDGWSRLHLLEWNERDNHLTEQRQRTFSITTISIVDRVLRPLLFDTSLAPSLLRYADRIADFRDADPELDPQGLRDRAQRDETIDTIVSDQIRVHLVPALNVLLRQFRPYAALETRLGAEFADLGRRKSQGVGAAENLSRYLSRFIYKTEAYEDDLSRAAWNDFRGRVSPTEEDKVFFLAIYQQALLRVWLGMARQLVEFGFSATEIATATRQGLEKLVADTANRYLTPDAAYARRVLWKSGTVNYGPQWAAEAWTDIQLATFHRDDVRVALVESLPAGRLDAAAREKISTKLKMLAFASGRRYADRMEREIRKDVTRNLADYFGGETEAGVMRDLRGTDKKEFDARISAKTQEILAEALAPLATRLMVPVEQLDSGP